MHLAPPEVGEVKSLLVSHLHDHYSLYGEFAGVRSARKHIGWYVKELPGGEAFRAQMNALESAPEQVAAVERYFDALGCRMDRIEMTSENLVKQEKRGTEMKELLI
jgi:tRNA-dihydrouridine synthase B